MSEEAHIIDIERLVLTDVSRRRPERLAALVEAEVRRALAGAGLAGALGVPDGEAKVAAEVAETVTRSVRGGGEGA